MTLGRCLILGVAVATAGCTPPPPQVTKYRVPKEAGLEPTRLLAAQLQRPDATWFFKLSGPTKAVGEQEPAFAAWLKSVKFPGTPEIDWQTPAGWTRTPGNEARFATLKIADKLEATVVKLGPSAGGFLANVNRWRGQIGLTDLTEAELPSNYRDVACDGGSSQYVDFTGTAAPGRPPMMMQPPGTPRPALPTEKLPPTPKAEEVTFTTPPNWQEQPARQFAFKTYKAGDGVTMTVSPLRGDGGGLLNNLNRWREQTGLPPWNDTQMLAEAKPVEIGGARGWLVDFPGTSKQIVGAIVPRGEMTWFFKMDGPPAAVGPQKAAFEAFVKSAKFGG